ncbi:MAG: OB-fold nucleic acid binding domain-containing protein, partial [Anaerolineae bacterium]|nr:OB-fold nucleic acid binding domain-containing protein [Anaerolineae bacterium]
MLASFDKLSRMLTQEKRLGYKNKAVMGGLEKFAPTWKAEAQSEATTDSLQSIVDEVEQSLQGYPEVPDEERPTYIHQILVKLHKGAEEESSAEPAHKTGIEAEKKPSDSGQGGKPAEPQTPPAPADNQAGKQDSAAEPPPPKPQPKPRRASKPKPAPLSSEVRTAFTDNGLNAPVTKLPGIKDAIAKKLDKLNVRTIGDFLTLYPRRYDDYRNLKTINRLEIGEEVTIIAQVWETRKRESRNRRQLVTSTLSDGTATIEVTWFNQPWLVDKLKPGTQIVISGKVDQYLGRLTFQSPEWEALDKDLLHTGRMVPVYPLTQGITAKWLRKQVKNAVDYWAERLPDYLPDESRERLSMMSLAEAIQQIHFPDDWGRLEAARRRLAFDELLLIQLGVLRQRQAWRAQTGTPITIEQATIEKFLSALPFQLTAAQRKALHRIVEDLRQATPMSRLLQGDVGSGKTVVALAAMVLTVMD